MFLTQATGVIMGPLSKLMGLIFNAIYNFFGNFGAESIALSVIVFTIVVRLLMFPFSIRSTRSQKIQSYLRPEFNKINKKYKGKKDQASMLAQQQETRELQAKYGINMTQGCLTSFIQLPIFLALYNVVLNIPAYVGRVKELYTPISTAIMESDGWFVKMQQFVADNNSLFARLREAVQFFQNTDATSEAVKSGGNYVVDVLGQCSPSLLDTVGNMFSSNPQVAQAISNSVGEIERVNYFFGINLTEAPGWRLTWALAVPIASFVFQFLSMLVMPQEPTGDPQQDAQMKSMRNMMYIMPLFSFFICITVPAGVGLYWAASAFISVIITLATNFYYKHANMEKIVEKARIKAEKKLEKNGGKKKKSFLDKMQEAAMGAEEEVEKQKQEAAMKNFSGQRLKNYTSSTAAYSETETETDVQYKPGSLAARANAMKQFNEKGDKKK